MPYMLNQYSPYPAPKVNYPTGDYRSISRLDRGKAEFARTSQLEAEIARKKAWEDAIFQKKLEELQRSLQGGGGVGSSSTRGPSMQEQLKEQEARMQLGDLLRPGSEFSPDPEIRRKQRAALAAEMERQRYNAMYGHVAPGWGWMDYGGLTPLEQLLGIGPESSSFVGPSVSSQQQAEQSARDASFSRPTNSSEPQQAGRSPGWATYQRPTIPSSLGYGGGGTGGSGGVAGAASASSIGRLGTTQNLNNYTPSQFYRPQQSPAPFTSQWYQNLTFGRR